MVIEENATLAFEENVSYLQIYDYTLTNYGVIDGGNVELLTYEGGAFYNYGIYTFLSLKGNIYDLTLSSIRLSAGGLSPGFAAGTREYAVTVDNSVTSIDITPELNTGTGVKSMTVKDKTATSEAASTVNLSVGKNTIPIVITADDGSNTTNTYTLTVTRESAAAYAFTVASFVSAGGFVAQDMLQWSDVDAPGGYRLEIYTESGTKVYSGSLTNNYTYASDVLTSSGSYYFTVYALDEDGTELSYKTSDVFTYERPSYTIYFASEGTYNTISSKTGSDGTLYSLETPIRTGYIFNGWYTEKDGGEKITTSTVFTSDQTVYGQWTLCTHADNTEQATCTDSATCSVCGATIEALGHDLTGDYNAWDETGHWHVCKHDGCTENDEDEKQTHTLTDYESNNDATYYSDGTETATCTADGCGYTITRADVDSQLTDNTLPTGTITVKENAFTSLINTITFGVFGKSNLDVTIEASDAETGVESVEYLIYEVSDGDTGLSQSDLAAKNDWLTYSSSFSISSNGKYIIYAKITDNSGNVAYISSDGIVKYTDSAADTQSISFTKTSAADVTASVTANGNTISAITNGTTTLGSEDYSVSYNADKSTATITFSTSYLNTLAAGSYTLAITYNPQGESYVESTNNEAPASTSMGLVVSRAEGSVADIENISKTYDGKAVSESTYTASSTGAATIEYKVQDADDTTYTSAAPTDAGSYTVRVTVAADEDYTEASATCDFTISPAELTVTADNKEITYGNAAPSYSVTYAGFADGDSVSDLRGTLAFACAYDPADDQSNNAGAYTITPSGYTSDNYTITYQTGTLTVKPKEITVRVESKSSVYGDSIAVLTATDSGIINGDTDVYSLSTKASSTAGVGTYDITGTVQDANYSITFEGTTGAYEITARELTVDVTVADKQYDGTTSATIDSATLKNIANNDAVSLENGIATFTSAEVGKNISISFTEFTLSGDAAVLKNYTLTQPTGVTASITNDWRPNVGTEYTVTAANANGWLNTDFTVTAADGYELSLTNTAEGDWTDTLTETDETGSGSITFYVRNTITGAISLETTEIYKIDKTVPTGTVSIGDGTTWDKFLETISFGLYYNSGQSVKASAGDTLSGMDQIAYVESETALTLSALKALAEDDWTAVGTAAGGSVTVPLSDGKQFVYYIRLTDKAGNVTYLSTDGATYDTSAPVISGIENGKTYCESVAFTVDDDNLDYVTVNGKETIGYTLQADGSDYEAIAYDKAGNSTQATVTVNNGHTFTNYVSDGNAGCTENGTETAKCDYCDATHTRTETGSTTGHSWSSDWTNDADFHWHECTNDGCILTENSVKDSYGAHSDGDGDGLCDDCGYIMEVSLVQTQIVQTELTEVPDGLKDVEFNTVEKITDEISRVLTSEAGYTDENVSVYDVKLQISTDGGRTWVDATEANFPAEGITIVLPYPDGTDGSTHDFTVTHMFTVTSAKLGITAGETEQPEVTKLEDGIQVTLKGLSPVGIAWKELSTNDAADSGNDTEITETIAATGTAASSGSTNTAGSAQTGDETNILLWIVLMLLAAGGITVIGICGRKRKYVR
ncbi:MAG: cadherin-like beta sandwich domain-containing protein [Clostridiales bacterium]|nr:cadherin-like beta sandwich domain-containing protein [Clostridiales bacterium]